MLLLATLGTHGNTSLPNRPETTAFALRRACLSAVLATAAWTYTTALGHQADAAECNALPTRCAASNSTRNSDNCPLLLADAKPLFHEHGQSIDHYDSQFAEPSLSDLRPTMPFPDFSNVMKLYQANELINIKLPPEDFEELDEFRPKLTTSSLDANDQRSVVGGRLLLHAPPEQESRFEAEVRLLWLCEYLQSPGAQNTAFFAPGDTAIFVTQGLHYGNNWAIFGKRFHWDFAGGLSTFAGFDTQVNSQQMIHIGSTGLRYAW